MNANKISEIVAALRCTKNENDRCAECKYAVHDFPGRFDYCDAEMLERDAANLIESLSSENAEWIKLIEQHAAEIKRREIKITCKTCGAPITPETEWIEYSDYYNAMFCCPDCASGYYFDHAYSRPVDYEEA